MSWTNSEGSQIESPRQPRCHLAESLRDWAAGDPARERQLVTWMLRDLLGFTTEQVARIEGVYPRTVRRRMAAIDKQIRRLTSAAELVEADM